MKGEIIGVWVSKYALTEGITHQRVRDCGDGMVKQIKPDGSDGWGYFHAGEWHESRDKAVIRAEVMRQRKIVSIGKQLAKLRYLSFDNVTATTDAA